MQGECGSSQDPLLEHSLFAVFTNSLERGFNNEVGKEWEEKPGKNY